MLRQLIFKATRRVGLVRNGFTLVELLVVIAIIGLLVSLLLPALSAARESGRRTQCKNNLRNLSLAVHNHLAAKEAFPPASQFRVRGFFDRDHPPDPARHSMITFLLPYFERASVFDQFDLRWDWNDTSFSRNQAASHQDLGGILICPSAPGGREDKHVSDYNAAIRIDPSVRDGLGELIQQGRITNRAAGTGAPGYGGWQSPWDGVLQRYYVNHGADRVIEDRRVVRRAHVRDGLSHTFLLFENAGKPKCYEYHRYVDDCNITRFRWASSTLYMTINDFCAGAQMMNCNNNSQPYGFHPAGGHFAFADASVRLVEEGIDPEVFVSLFTLAAGDVGSL